MIRLAALIAVLGSAISPALAAPLVDATAPCVNSGRGAVRYVRDPILDAKSLRYCTGVDRWSLDLRDQGAVASAPTRPPARTVPAVDATALFTNDKGMSLATVDETHVRRVLYRCKAPCKTFKFSFSNPATDGMFAFVNAKRTLGAVLYHPDTENGLDSEVIAFDLVAGKQVGRIVAEDVDVLDHGFIVNYVKLSTAPRGSRSASLAAPDRVWKPLGSTDVIALRDEVRGEIVIQETTTGKVRVRIPHRRAQTGCVLRGTRRVAGRDQDLRDRLRRRRRRGPDDRRRGRQRSSRGSRPTVCSGRHAPPGSDARRSQRRMDRDARAAGRPLAQVLRVEFLAVERAPPTPARPRS